MWSLLLVLCVVSGAGAQFTGTVTGFPVTSEPGSAKPKITTGLSNLTVPEYGTAQFRCVASGVPTPTIVIAALDESRIPDFTEIANIEQDDISEPEGLLVITNVTAKEHHDGAYRCIAYNSAGYDISDAWLVVEDVCHNVVCPGQRSCFPVYETASYECLCLMQECTIEFLPVCGSDCEIHFNPCMWNNSACDSDYPPDIIATGSECPETTFPSVHLSQTQDVNLVEGGVIELNVAELAGYPEPVVTWYRADNAGSRVAVGTGRDLRITDARSDNSGRYYCEAVNCGSDTHTSSTVDVYVRAAPKPTTEQKVCSVFGDPHVVTFDGMKYKVGGNCHYVLAMDCVSVTWVVYGEFTPCGRGSCLAQISLYHKRDAVILGRGWLVSYRGVKQQFKQGVDFQIGSLDFSFDGLYLKIAVPESGITLIYDGAMSLQIAVDMDQDAGRTPLCGLCGNNDGDDSNEAVQLRSIGNEVEGNTLEDFLQTWKVDRGGYCQKPAALLFDRRLPCGNDFRKNDAAVAACQQIVDNQELYKCHNTVNMNIFYEACLFDYCGVELMAEAYPVHCAVASSYAKHCQLLGVSILDEVWRVEMTCPDIAVTQQAILEHGCPQLQSPLA